MGMWNINAAYFLNGINEIIVFVNTNGAYLCRHSISFQPACISTIMVIHTCIYVLYKFDSNHSFPDCTVVSNLYLCWQLTINTLDLVI